jgi:mitogen-activated protein kinase kinase
MASPNPNIRKKRNFKGLQLGAESAPTTPKDQEPVPTRQAPTPMAAAASAPVGGGKKRPPPMIIKAPKIPSHHNGAMSAVEQEGNDLLPVSNNLNPPHSAVPIIKRNTYHATLSNTLASLDMNAEIKLDLKDDDLKELQELGQGNGGSVKKVEHIPTKTIMAKKVLFFLPFGAFIAANFSLTYYLDRIH